MDKQIENKLIQLFKEYIDNLDDSNYDELFTTDKGFAMREFTNFLEYYHINLPDFVKTYYDIPDED